MAVPALSEADLSWHSLTQGNVNVICFTSIIVTAARTRFLVDEVGSSYLGQITGIREVTIK